MGRIKNINEMVKATIVEESMASAGTSPLQIVSKAMESMEFSEEEMKNIKDMMSEMDMDEESDMDEFEAAIKECGSYDEMKKTIEKYMKK